MAKILFLEDKQKARNQEYGSLLVELGKKYKLTIVSSQVDMLTELNKEQMDIGILSEPEPPEYDLVICDTGAFYKLLEEEPQQRAQQFESKVLPYFRDLQIPVILLAEKGIADYIRDAVKVSKLTQFDKPFDPGDVVKKVDSFGI